MNDYTIDNDKTIRPGEGAGAKNAPGRIDKYELQRELGEGGFGAVYLARDTVADVDVAVKGLPPEVKHNAAELESIRKNFALVKRLRHPNIVAVTDLHQAVAVSYTSKDVESKLRVFERDTMVVMDYAPGVTLAHWRRQFPGGKVPPGKAIAVVRQIASALDYAHSRKVLHRDVKPANVMVETTENGTAVARVLDFGLAAEIRSSMGRLSREIRDTSGTRPYMAPEQWKGDRQGPATDQYALAAMFYELVAGEVPFASVFDCGDAAVMRLAVTTDAPKMPPSLPRNMRKALAVALSKKPEDRFASCGDFVAALEGRKTSRGGGWAALAAAALLAAIAGGGWIYRQHQERRHEEVRQDEAAAKVLSWDAGNTEATDLKNKAVSNLGPKEGDCKTFTLPGGVKMDMVYVAPGRFKMGSENGEEDEKPVHSVSITKGYWIGKHPVTQSQWSALASANNVSFDKENPAPFFCSTGGGRDRVQGLDTSDFPMENISWNDCDTLVKALNRNATGRRTYSIPTEAQWEFAARGGNKSHDYTYSGSNNMDKLGWYYENSGVRRLSDSYWKVENLSSNKCRTHSVTEKNIGNELGIVGMSGNVWEWCYDWYDKDYYKLSPNSDPQGPTSGAYRVLRGGSWFGGARDCRSADRYRGVPGFRNFGFGFRLCCSAGPRE